MTTQKSELQQSKSVAEEKLERWISEAESVNISLTAVKLLEYVAAAYMIRLNMQTKQELAVQAHAAYMHECEKRGIRFPDGELVNKYVIEFMEHYHDAEWLKHSIHAHVDGATGE
ncbi:hypothetical protein GR11A_00204 [Vibrio phage vB_VcorM_GR11A]|nr:hypothetical protein GR11A_00204 [Vibrio phage vB_VcorM_GR11A]